VNHRTTSDFWACYRQLPRHIQKLAGKNFALLRANPYHPSLHFKKVTAELWSVRVGINYRALEADEHDTVIWFWIGPHAEYDRLI